MAIASRAGHERSSFNRYRDGVSDGFSIGEVDPPSHKWILDSPTSLTVNQWLFRLDIVAVITTATFVLYCLTERRPINGALMLLAPGIPLLVFGQLWIILTGTAQQPKRTGGVRQLFSRQQSINPLVGLTTREKYLLGTLFVSGWLAAVTGFIGVRSGSPDRPRGPGSSCPWPLSDHGSITCVSHWAYLAAGAQVQRGACGVLLGFFTFHMFGALSEIRRRRGTTSTVS